MIRDISVPDIGADEVEVTEILVAVGDLIEVEQSLLVVEGDKASMEIPAPVRGVVRQIMVKVGDKVASDSLIMLFAEEDDGKIPLSQSATNSQQSPAGAVQHATPIVAGSVAPAVGVSPVPSTTTPCSAMGFVENLAYVHASPLVRRLARELGIDLSKVAGSGPKNRILQTDLQEHLKHSLEPPITAAPTGLGSSLQLLPWPKVDFSKYGEVELLELSRINKLAGENLHRNWVMIPHVTQWDSADITELEEFRQQQNREAERNKPVTKLTLLVFMMQAVAKALTQFPRFNSALSPDGQHLILKKYFNIGIAVDTPNGLVVPVIRQVDKKGAVQLSQELAEISGRARAGKLTTAELQGGCFTISSLGGVGGSAFTPIINAPEVAILGVSRAEMQPQWDGETFTARLMLPLSLSYDHRVIDGAEGARFITALKQLLSDIRRLAL